MGTARKGAAIVSSNITEANTLGRFCTIREAADYLGVGETFVKQRIRSGELASVALGAGRRVVVESLVAFADAREREGRRALG
jgi:excisionase family DNA binding protein